MYKYRLKNTVLRARIPVSKGRTLMGVADFTGTLKHGEVFVQYSERGSSGQEDLTRMVVLSGVDVLVHRSPCYHPGDLRLLRCQSDVPRALKMLHDCIVFPTCGPRPHPDECTGGDLDGDVFTVIWDERLLPDRERIVPAMTLMDDMSILPEARETKMPVDSPRLIEFYLFSMEHNILGAASNAHVAVCDADLKYGSFSREAKILAEVCAREVDYIKNPKHAEIVRKLSPPQYPDFMANTKKPAYKSQKVLGKMYRRSLALFTSTAPSSGDVAACDVDESFLTEKYLKHIDSASIVYDQYKLAIRMLLQMSGARSEAELATGMIIDLLSEHRADYFRYGERSRDAFYKTQLAFKKQFLEAYGTHPECERRQVAAAWYAVAYKDESEERCLGFPWILADLLIKNKSIRCKNTFQSPTLAPSPTRCSTSDEIMNSTTCQLQLCLHLQIKESFATLLAGFHDRLQALTTLRLALVPHFGTQDVDCVLFGSSNLLTFEAQSDLDVVLQPVQDVSDLKALAQFASSAEGIANIKLIENTHVPVLSLSVESNWTIEISTSRKGPIKTAWFRAYMLKYPSFWPTVFFLLKWGKAAGLVRRRRVAGNGYGRSMFTPIGFMWLLLTFCLEKEFLELVECPRDGLAPVDTDAEMSFWSSVLERSQSTSGDVTAARVIMSFFSHFSDLARPASAFGFDDPLDPINNTRLPSEDTEIFRQECYIALHQLIISNGDFLSLLCNQKDNRLQITLSRALSKHVHASPEFHAAKIVRDSGVHADQVKLTFARHPNALRPDLYVADVEGDGVSVRRIEEKIERIEEALGTPQQRLATKRFHRSGCSLLLFEGALSQSEKIAFQAYDGPHQAAHQLHPLHQAHLTSFMNGKAWLDHAVDSLATKFIHQMVKLSHFEKLNPGQATAKAIARFGHHYLIHLPRSFHEESITLATIDKLEREFERGRASRELYESVMVARQRDRKSAQKETHVTAEEATSEKDGAATGGGSDESDGGGCGDSGYRKDDSTRSQGKRQMNGLSLEKASAIAGRDRGVAHSFYPLIDPCIAPFLRDFALKSKRMHEVANSEAYQVSMVRESCEFYVRLTPTLQLVNVKTRPCRWLSATLKMHQELVENGSRMDSTPDVRYYVSATEEVPQSDPLRLLLERACQKAKNGQGMLQFVDDPSKQAAPVFEPKRVRVSNELAAEGVNPASITSVRHIRSTTYQSHMDGVEFRVLQVVEYSGKGFGTMRQKTEAEIVMPPLTPEARVSAAFARRFLLAGVELVAFLREQQHFGLVGDDEQ